MKWYKNKINTDISGKSITVYVKKSKINDLRGIGENKAVEWQQTKNRKT